jgi:methylsterol monooxygenase
MLSLLMSDFFFYIGHWILHLPAFYKKYHKKHHEITSPVGFSALYATTLDLYLANIIPVYLPMLILSSHPYTIILWMILTTGNAVFISHSGFEYFSNFHDYHHEKFTKNYGTNIFMDYVCGTLHT